MAFITDILSTIKNARKGKDMRQAIYDGIQQCYKDATGHPESVAATVEEIREVSANLSKETADRKAEVNTERKRIDNLIQELPATAGEYQQSKLVLHSYDNTAVKCTTTSRNYTNVPAFTTYQGGPLSYLYTKKSNYQIAVNKSGLYLFELRIHVNSLIANKRVELAPFVNDTRIAALTSSYNTPGSFILTQIAALPLWLSANDTVDFKIAPIDAAEVSLQLGDVLVYAIDWEDKFKIPDYTGYAAETKDIRTGADGTVYGTAGEAVRKQIGNLTEDFNNVAKVDTDYWNLLDANNYQVKEKTFINNGIEIINNEYYTYMYIKVKPNTLYRFHDSEYASGQARFVNAYDDNKSFLQTYPEVFNITTPATCKYICVTFKYADNTTQSRGTTYVTSFDVPDFFNVSNTIAPSTMKIPSKYIDKGNNLENAEHRIATFNFQFDDGAEQDVTVYETFKNKGLTCGFALLSTNVRNREYLFYQAEGFEILSHSTDADPMETDAQSDSEIERKLKDSKQILTRKGYNIRGWVTPNSTMNNKYIPLLRKYYDYGMTVYYYDHPTYPVYQNDTADTCKLYRISLVNDYDTMKAVVDDAIANNGFVTFYGHSRDIGKGISLSAMNQLLDYLNTKIADLQCYVLKPSDAFDYYFHVRHSDYLKLLS